MKNIKLKELEKVNGSFYFPWFPGYSESEMEATGKIRVKKHFFAPNSYYSKDNNDFVNWFEAQCITYIARKHPSCKS